MDPRFFFITPYVFSASAITGTGIYTLLRRDSTGALYLALMNFSAAWWALTEGLLYLGASAESNILLTKLQYLGIATINPFFLLFIMEVFGHHDLITWRLKSFFFSISCITLFFAFSYPHITCLWTSHFEVSHGLFPMLAWNHGYYFWIFVGYNYCLLAVSTIILIHSLNLVDPIMKKRAKVFLFGLFPVWIVNAIYISGSSPLFNVDMEPLAFVFTAAAICYGYYQYNMLDLFPAARKAVYSHVNELILVLDPKDRIVEINPAAAALLNVNETWAIGRSTNEVLKVWPPLAERLKKGRGGMIDSPNGSPRRTFDLRLTPLKDRKGQPLGRLATLRDTSSLTPFDNSSKLMAVLDRNGVIIDANDAFLNHLQSDSVLFGQRIDARSNILNQSDNLRLIKEAFKTNRMLTFEFEYGGRVYKNRLFPIKEKSDIQDRVMCMLKDITREKIEEKRLIHANKMVAIGRLAAGVAHEIRNPLGLIRNHCFLLKRQCLNNLNATGTGSIESIESAVEQAMNVIEHLLQFTRIPSISEENCNIREVIERVAAISSETASKSKVKITVKCQVEHVDGVSADALNIIIANLLANALDAMPEGGLCRIEVFLENRELKLVISDSGPGLEKYHLDQIFEPFFSTKSKGTGLGLYIVYNEVQKYGGSITAKSEPGQGTSFTIVIPLAQQDITNESR